MPPGADTTILAAAAVGVVSFVSPCVLPLVPGYLSAISGIALADLEAGGRRAALRVLGPALLFCFSFSIVFVALGMTATGLGSLLVEHRILLNKLAGAAIIAMGALFLAAPLVPALNRTWHPQALVARAGSGGPVIAGAAFAVAWVPCVGPTLAAILATAATKATVGDGAILLTAYSAGLAIPFLLSAVAFGGVTPIFRWFQSHYSAVAAVSGLILIAMGVLVFTDQLFYINNEIQRALDALGINFFQSF